nr:hypothetical protein [Inquilinus limosus]
MDLFALDPQRLAAGRQDVGLRRGPEDLGSQAGGAVDHMLAAVEDQQEAAVAQMGDQAGHRILRPDRQAQHRCHGDRHQAGIGHQPEIDEQGGAGEGIQQLMRHRRRHRGLADPAGADDGDEARRGQLLRQGPHAVLPPHHPRQPRRQEGGAGEGGADRGRALRHRRGRTRPQDRRHEAVAPSRQRRDVARAVLAVAQRLAQPGDVEAQAALLDDHVGPHLGDQLALADRLVRAGDEGHQDVQRPGAEIDRGAVPGQQPLAHGQAEGTEGEDVPRLRRPDHHSQPSTHDSAAS